MSFVVGILLLKVGQRTGTGRPSVRDAADVRPDSRLNLPGDAAVILDVVSAHHHVQASSPPGNCRCVINLSPTHDGPRGSGSQVRRMDRRRE
jgi:hypothetical protein